jgi:hypothetical protein
MIYSVVSDLRGTMFCPLCKSEYREGVATCGDCKIPLVATSEDARKIPTSMLWEGRNQKKFDDMSAALQDAGIPFLVETQTEAAEMGREVLIGLLKVIFWRFGAFRNRKSDLLGWRIKVLQSDRSRAQHVIS